MTEPIDFRRFLDRAVGMPRGVDAIAPPPAPVEETPRERELAAHRACFTPMPPPHGGIYRPKLLEALALLDESVKFGECGDARMFDTTRQARAILQRLVDGGT